jgi:hypothetical protein
MPRIAKRKKVRRRRGQRVDYVSSKTGQKCQCRSGWEVKYLTWLDADPAVITFVYEPFKIPYTSNRKTGKIRNYIPDVLVTYSDRTVLVEIKPSKRVTGRTNVKKMLAAKDFCLANSWEYSLVTEKELKLLGLL